jgi:transcriptional regulator with XRE-family HTH domain
MPRSSAEPDNGIGHRVRTARRRLGWTREALAFHAGVSWSAVAQIESGRRTNLRPSTLAALAHALGVTIDYLVSGRAAAPVMLDHCALPYESVDEFATVVGSFVEEAIVRDEPILAVTTKANRKLLEKRLGADARHIEFADRSSAHRSPATALRTMSSFMNDRLEAGAGWVRIIGEPRWGGRSEGHDQLWTNYESLVNLAFSGAPASILCAYDECSLDPAIVKGAYATHPRTIENGEPVTSPHYVEPGEFLL